MIWFLLFLCYQLLQLMLLPVITLYIGYRLIRKKTVLHGFSQRLGFVPQSPKDTKIIWLHAVSVGEILSLQQLIDTIKNKNPRAICYLTCGTTTGKKTAQAQVNADIVSYLPYDLLPLQLLAFKRIRPHTIIIVEAEWWPNLFFLSKLFATKLILVNARIRPKRIQKLMRMRLVVRSLLHIPHTIFVQTAQDKAYFAQLGIDPKKITCMGNLKNANVIRKHQHYTTTIHTINSPYPPHRPIILAGSIHPTEATIYLRMMHVLKQTWPHLRGIIVPRHLHWQKELIAHCRTYHLSYTKWNDATVYTEPTAIYKALRTHDLLLVCKIGLLFNLYQVADIYCLGGTFAPIGGHNILEPLAWGKPTIIGPHHENIQPLLHTLTELNAAYPVADEPSLIRQAKQLLQQPDIGKTGGDNGRIWLLQNAQQVKKHMQELVQML